MGLTLTAAAIVAVLCCVPQATARDSARRLLATAGKLDVCHYDSSGSYSLININLNAWQNGHSKHAGDCCLDASLCPTSFCNSTVVVNEAEKTCKCKTGWTGPLCQTDVNECLDFNGGCSQHCNNTLGSFYCYCDRGYYLDADNKTCNDASPPVSCPTAFRDGMFPASAAAQQRQQKAALAPQQAAAGAQLLQDEVVYVNPVSVVVGSMCPESPGGLFATLQDPSYGELATDNWMCQNRSPSPSQVGIAAQDFVAKQKMNSKVWAAFTTSDPHTDATTVTFQGLELVVVGNVAADHPAGANCSLQAINMDIYAADPATEEPAASLYSAQINLPQDNTFIWTKNESVVIAFDIMNDIGALRLPVNSSFWLRLQLVAPYGGPSGAGNCFVLLGTSSTALYPQRPLRWQESGGYKTTCGGADSATSIPGPSQTAAACLNGGAPGSTGTSYCSSHILRNSCDPAQTCPVAPMDLVFAFYGFQGLSGV